jgi:hypothetical protein
MMNKLLSTLNNAKCCTSSQTVQVERTSRYCPKVQIEDIESQIEREESRGLDKVFKIEPSSPSRKE